MRRPESGAGSARHHANASDILDSDSELEVQANPETFAAQQMPQAEKTYATFEEADRAADKQASEA